MAREPTPEEYKQIRIEGIRKVRIEDQTKDWLENVQKQGIDIRAYMGWNAK